MEQEPVLFHVIRVNDETGISGTGRVIDGVVWSNGWVSICWRTDLDPVKRGKASVTFFESFDAFEQIHIESHPTNNTKIVWDRDIRDKERTELEKAKISNKDLKKELRDLKKEISSE